MIHEEPTYQLEREKKTKVSPLYVVKWLMMMSEDIPYWPEKSQNGYDHSKLVQNGQKWFKVVHFQPLTTPLFNLIAKRHWIQYAICCYQEKSWIQDLSLEFKTLKQKAKQQAFNELDRAYHQF